MASDVTGEIKPAFSREDWARVKADGAPVARPFVDDVRYCPDGEERKQIAALALYGQPFGFTRADVQQERLGAQLIEELAKDLPAESWATLVVPSLIASFRSRADRIEALLPPE